MSMEHEAVELRTMLREHEARALQDNRIDLALEVGQQNGKDIASLAKETSALRDDVRLVLVELGKVTERTWFDRSLMRLALAAITFGCGGAGLWVAYQFITAAKAWAQP